VRADVGALSDQVARKNVEGREREDVLHEAAVGANIPEKIAPLKSALGTVTIERRCLFLMPLRRCSKIPVSSQYLINLEDFGFKKGKTDK